MAPIAGISSYQPLAEAPSMQGDLEKFDPDLRSLWQSSLKRHFATPREVEEEFQKHEMPKGSYFAYNWGADHCFIAFIPINETKIHILKLIFTVICGNYGILDGEQFFQTFQDFATHYNLPLLHHHEQAVPAYKRGQKLIDQGFANGWERCPEDRQKLRLRLHKFSNQLPFAPSK